MSLSMRSGIYCGFAILLAALIVSAVAQMGQAQSNDVLPDVVGIRPGIPIGEAYQLLKAHQPKGTIDYAQKRVQEMSGKLITHALQYSSTGSVQDPEVIVVDITFPPAPQTVWRVSRYLHFEPGKEPVPATLLTALRQKYGQDVPSTMPQNAYWVFDRQGHPANRSAGLDLSDCAMYVDHPNAPGIVTHNVGDDSAPSMPLSALLMQTVVAANRDACHEFVYVAASLSLDSPRNSLVRAISTTITDVGVLERSQIAAHAFLNRAATSQQQRVIKKAKEQPAPVF